MNARWHPGPLKRWLKLNDSGVWGDDPTGTDDVLVLRSTNIFLDGTWDLEDVAERSIEARDRTTKRLLKGDLVVVKSSGSVAHLGKTAIVDEHIASLKPCFANFVQRLCPGPEAEPRYVWYVLNSKKAASEMEVLGNTTTGLRNLNGGIIGSVTFPGAPKVTQRAIADYLDGETARIDSLIEKKARMVELLDEALVTRIETELVGIEYVDIPLRRLLRAPPQYGASESGEVGEGDWPRYIRITDLRSDGSLREDDVRRLPHAVARPYLLNDKDVLMARSGATVGKAFIYRSEMGPCCFAGYLIRFQFDSAMVEPQLVEAWTQTRHYWSQIREAALQATIENVSAERYKELIFPLPPRADQAHLTREIEQLRLRTDRLRAKLIEQVQLLRERREALITAAITGDIDIPGVAA